jgi:excisionase family DNA binding protein
MSPFNLLKLRRIPISQQVKLDYCLEWLDLKAVQRYACVSERTVRDWIHHPENPLPAVQVDRGKILIRRTQFDHWLETHPFRSIDSIGVGQIVDEVMDEFKRPS